jgi:5-methylcytosine-specific restriction endonuclease McrA
VVCVLCGKEEKNVTERKAVGKKLRFEVFKRDLFTCTYCGQKPPSVVLQCDHVVPVAMGGSNAIENLTTSCFDCNSGKSDRSLGSVPESIAARAELLAEREEQEKAFAKLLRARGKRRETEIDDIEAILLASDGRVFTDRFRLSVKHFLEKLPIDRVTFAAERAFQKCRNVDDRTKYFCGICWKIIKEGER